MRLRVAELDLCLDARGTDIPMAVPAYHARFLAGASEEGDLHLHVRNGRPIRARGWRPRLFPSETWELWQDEAGRTVFVAPRQSPPRRHVFVDASFASGEVVGEFGASIRQGTALFPLQDMDIMLFPNWLAGFGNLILHAAGAEIDGRGYCFAGSSESGKSTLAAFLSETSSATVLGEDQVILRYLEGRFWIFGTPWHLNPALCSPLGVPLEKLFFLDRTSGHGVGPCGPLEGTARLLQTAFVPYYDRAAVTRILDTLARLAEQVLFYTLGYQLGADVLGLVRDA